MRTVPVGLTVIGKTALVLALAAAWLVLAPLAAARSIGECDGFCSHHHGNYQTCYRDCLRR